MQSVSETGLEDIVRLRKAAGTLHALNVGDVTGAAPVRTHECLNKLSVTRVSETSGFGKTHNCLFRGKSYWGPTHKF
jgi:hypothetical protein